MKYSQTERVERADHVEHPMVREALRLVGIDGAHAWSWTSMADVPAGTGLGSSGSFTAGLLRALPLTPGRGPREVYDLACQIEIERLGAPVGKQDQYIAAVGGDPCFEFRTRRRRRGVPAAELLHRGATDRGRSAAVLHRR